MKGLILVNAYTHSEHELYQPRRLQEELAELGVAADLKRNDFCPAYLDGGIKTDTAEYDFCVYLDKDKYVPRLLEGAGMRLFNRAQAVEVCDDKMRTHMALAGVVRMPATIAAPLCYTPVAPVSAALLDKVERVLGYPVVVKECYGSLGKGVYLAENRAQLASIAEKLSECSSWAGARSQPCAASRRRTSAPTPSWAAGESNTRSIPPPPPSVRRPQMPSDWISAG